jgi:pimeloyl-ACP methyl ester carboxylesterase
MDAETHFIDVAGKKTQIVKGGSGPAVVFLHSALGEAWWADWCDDLAQDFTVIIPAHPGFGDSEGLELIEDMEDIVFHYDDLFASLGLVKPALVGQSLGGWIAAEYAVRWPERISKLVLIDAAGLRVEQAPTPDMWAHRPPELADMLFADHSQPLYLMMQSFDPEHPPDAEVLIPFLKGQQATARLGWNPYLHDPKLARRLDRITCPTLVLWGERDGLIPPPHGEAYAAGIVGARLETIPGCGHLPLVERPAQTVAAIRPFLASS